MFIIITINNKKKFIGHFESLIEEENKRGLNLRNEERPEYAFSIEDNTDETLDLQELLTLKERKNCSSNVHLQVIHQIKLNLSTDQPASLYYYKRWIWMNFPWICQHKSEIEFGQLLAAYESQETRMGSIFMRCLAIIYLNKLKKQNVFGGKNAGGNKRGSKNQSSANISQITICQSTM